MTAHKILDLGMHPFADTFIPNSMLHKSEPVYPLQVSMDPDTKEIRLITPTNGYDRYNLYEYSYTSANSKFSRSHWDRMAVDLIARAEPQPTNDFSILEIGSNDGYLLERFGMLGIKNIRGVDASNKLVGDCKAKGLTVESGLFGNGFRSMQCYNFRYDLIVANNVVNHSDSPNQFFAEAVRLLKPNGKFVFELPYWLDTVKSRRVEQVYHEHVTYFTVAYVEQLCKRIGAKFIDFHTVDYHGGSLRCTIGVDDGHPSPYAEKIAHQIDIEHDAGLFDFETYRRLDARLRYARLEIITEMCNIAKEGYPIIAVGAAAKGNTLLNYLNLDSKMIDCVLDSSPSKVGKYTPLSRIPILPDEHLRCFSNPHIFFLAWNIEHILLPKLREINPSLRVISSAL